MKLSLPPAIRITLGILCTTVMLITLADMLGVAPNNERDVVDQRQRYVEMLSVQLSLAAEKLNANALQSILLAAARQNHEVLSAAVRRNDGVIAARFGDHEKNWNPLTTLNTATQMKMPIMRGTSGFATLEIVFQPSGQQSILGVSLGTMSALLTFVFLVGGITYWILIRRSLIYLDPGAVVPERVRSALNVLANGVLIVDDKERIVLANQIFSQQTGVAMEKLVGTKPSALPWIFKGDSARSVSTAAGADRQDISAEKTEMSSLPWIDSLRQGIERRGVMLAIRNDNDIEHVFSVSSSPILDNEGTRRGVMVGFDDITELQTINHELHAAINELHSSREQIEAKNAELVFLATRDPLTGCFNRRAFSQMFDDAFALALEKQTPLSCIMTDIDHFKSVNDTYGHAMGDKVIRMVSGILQDNLPDGGVVGRYGGEEFCVLLPGLSIFEARKFAERCRLKIVETRCDGIGVTSSFGISGMARGALRYDELVNQADEALYVSKKSGRNCVTLWSTKAESASG